MNPLPPPALLVFLTTLLRSREVWLPGPSSAWDPAWRSALPGRLWPRPFTAPAELPPQADLVILPAPPPPQGPAPRLFLLPEPVWTPAPSLAPLLAPLRLPGQPAWWLGSGRARLEVPVQAALEELQAQERGGAALELLPPEVGCLAHVLASARGASRALELGSGAGAGTLWLASGLPPEGRLTAVEPDAPRLVQARRSLRAAGLADRVAFQQGLLERLASRLPRGFDLLLMDEGLEDRAERLAGILDLGLLAPGALVLAHGGRGDPTRDAAFQALLQLDARLKARLRLQMGNGVSLALVG